MPWVTLPVAPDALILAAHFDEVRLAINERYNAAGLANPALVDVATNGDQPLAILASYRTAIDTIIPYYANPALSYNAYTKAACLTAAIGAANWIAAPDATMYVGQINDMRTVLNLLRWVRKVPAVVGQQYRNPFSCGLFDTWDNCWTQAKADFGGGAWQAYPPGGWYPDQFYCPGATFLGREPQLFGGFPRGHDWDVQRYSDLSFSVANFPVLATKVKLTTGGDFVRLRLYPAANFAGVPVPVNVAGDLTVDVAPVTPNAVNHMSSDIDTTILDDFRPADADGSAKSSICGGISAVVIHHTFSYQ
jgi:hypothetical protein